MNVQIKSLKLNETLIKTSISLTKKDILDANQTNEVGLHTNPKLREHLINEILKSAKEKI